MSEDDDWQKYVTALDVRETFRIDRRRGDDASLRGELLEKLAHALDDALAELRRVREASRCPECRADMIVSSEREGARWIAVFLRCPDCDHRTEPSYHEMYQVRSC